MDLTKLKFVLGVEIDNQSWSDYHSKQMVVGFEVLIGRSVGNINASPFKAVFVNYL